MANTQISITDNGTKTLKTACKYCDRDIDVIVNVPTGGGGITPTGTKDIATNGTHDVTAFAYAKVNVPTPQPTQFTNILTHASTQINLNVNHEGTARNGAFAVFIDLAALGITTAQALTFRMRGLWVDLSVNSIYVSTDKTTWSAKKSMMNFSKDSHGDCMVTISSYNPQTQPYLAMVFRHSTSAITASAYTGSILTINEPIGNGGYVG